jgi:hypothetical protein
MMVHAMRLLLLPMAALLGCASVETPQANSGNVAQHDGPGEPGFAEYATAHGIRTLSGATGGGPPPTVEGLRLEAVAQDSPIKIDGVLPEWPAMAKASVASGPDRVAMNVALQYDDTKLYVGADITDSVFREGKDHVSLLLAIPRPGKTFATYDILFFAGRPGESEGRVQEAGGGAVPGASILEAPTSKGYTLEAAIPLPALPELRSTRVGVHAVARYVHGDTVVATGGGDLRHPESMPWAPSEPEISMIEQLLEPKGLSKVEPSVDIVADLTGDGVRERIAVFDRYLTICGSGFLKGGAFYFREIDGELVSLETRDVSGRGKQDVVLRRRAKVGESTRETIEVLSALTDSEEPTLTFSHEISVRRGQRHIDNAVHMSRGEIDVNVEPATTWDELSYEEPIIDGTEPILFPWGNVRSQTWRFEGRRFAKISEAAQAELQPSATRTTHERHGRHSAMSHPIEPPTPKVSEGDDLLPAVLENYRKDRHVPPEVQAKADLRVQVSGDPRPERVVLLDRDLVIFGPGFKNGTGYLYETLNEFAEAADIASVSARDLTGDGAAEIVVRGQRHITHSNGEVISEVLVVFTFQNELVSRVFAAETARTQGAKRIQGLLQFVPAPDGKSFDILAAPGMATGWKERTYPWAQDQPGNGDIEPLLLPWGGIRSVRYAWNGSQFAQQTE